MLSYIPLFENLTDWHMQKTKISVWLYDNIEMRIEGRIIVCQVSLN